MPSQIANASAIRASGWSIRAFASFITGGTPVATGTVTNTPVYPAGTVPPYINTTYVTGSFTDVLRGMEVVFSDSATGAFKGRSHVIYGRLLDALNIPIREFAQANLNLVAGDTFRVYKEWRLHDKLVEATAQFNPDQLGYTDEGSNPPPVACSGGHFAGNCDVGQVYATVLTTGGSYTVDPDSAGTVTHLWTLPTGVTFAPGSANTDATPTLRATQGEYTVYHAVTDASNSKVTTQHIAIKVHNAANPPHQILYTPDTATPDSGFGGSVQIVSGLTTQAAIPDGCLCIVWGIEYVNGSQVSYRNTANGRGHILCIGIVRRDSQSGTPDGARRVTFELISPLARLKELSSYSKVMEASATPDAWNEVKALGIKRGVIQLIQFYSTFVEAGFDLTFDSAFIDYLYPALYVQKSTFYGQADELAQGVDARLTCDRTGRLNIHTDPKFIPLASRAAVTKTWTFIPRDIGTFEFPREHVDTVEKYKTSGFTGGASGNTPLFSLYPGAAPGEGVETPVRDRLIVTDQTDLNARTGRYGAAADVVFQDANGLKYRAFALTLTLRGVYDFFDFSKEYQDFSANLAFLARDVDLTKFLFCLASTSISYDFATGTGITTCVFDVVPNAAPGETFTPPQANEMAIPSTTLPPPAPIGLPATFPGGIPRGVANMAAFCVSGLALTGNFQAAAPVWVGNSWASLSLNGTFLNWCPDGFNPGSGWIITTTRVYYFTISTLTLTSKHTFGTATAARGIDASFSQRNHMAVSSYYPGVGTKVLHTEDNTTFTEVVVSTAFHTDAGYDGNMPGIYYSSKVADKIIIIAYKTNASIGGGNNSAGYVSANAGVSWAETNGTNAPLLSPTYIPSGHLHAPFGAAGDNTLYWAQNDTESDIALYRSVGAAQVDVSPVLSANPYSILNFNRQVMDSAVSNPNRLLVVGMRAGGNRAVFLSNTQGASWAPLSGDGTLYVRCALSGNDPNVGWLWGDDFIAQLAISGNSAVEVDKSGNLAALALGDVTAIGGY